MTNKYKVSALLFLSGVSALTYQIAWLRELRLVFGTSTAASAAVLAIFMGGLGVGGALIGKRADLHPRPLRLFSTLELLVAASAALTPALVLLVRHAYIQVGGTIVLGPWVGALVRLLGAALVLAVPTCLMGGTLPAAARAVSQSEDLRRRGVALLYGMNTLGAVCGCLLTTFLLLERLGTRKTLWLACGLSAAVGIVARRLAGAARAEASEPERPPAGVAESEPPASLQPPSLVPARFVYSASFVLGFAFFLMEIVWYRLLGPILGGTVFTFGLILAVALLGIGGGGLLYSRLGSNRQPSADGLAITCLVESFLLAVPYALGDEIAILALRLRELGGVGFVAQILGWAVVAGIVVFPASFIAGFQFPLLVAILGRGSEHVGRQIGATYAWNTAGAIVGSIAGGFGLLAYLSAPWSWFAVVLLLVALAVVASAVGGPRPWRWSRLPLPLGAGIVLATMLVSRGPTAAWRHSGIGGGRAGSLLPGVPNLKRDWLNAQRRNTHWEAEGVESSVALQSRHGLAFVVNGKIDGNARSDAPTQVMSGLLGAILHPAPRRALVVGLGTGSTAGWLGAIDGMERVDVVELEPAILHVAKACQAVNKDAMTNPRVHVRIADGREELLTTPRRYDLIVSEPSNPYRAGIASLFTEEYYRAASAKLPDDGLFVQWMQGYEVDGPTIATFYATLLRVFPFVETWQVHRSDIVAVASRRPIAYDIDRMRARVAQEPWKSALSNTWRTAGVEGLLARFVGDTTLARTVAQNGGNQVNTDDHNVMEFGFARTVGRRGLFRISDLRGTASALNVARPTLVADAVDWARVQDETIAMSTGLGELPSLEGPLAEDQRHRGMAQVYYLRGDARQAVSAWRRQLREPSGPTELAVVAEGFGEVGDDRALRYIDGLRAIQPAEADAALARLRLRQGRHDEAAQALEAAFRRYRTDPWPSPEVMRRALILTSSFASERPEFSSRLFAATRAPFAVYALNEERTRVLTGIAARMDLRAGCTEALHPLEPHVPWSAEFLLLRKNCYEATSDPRARRATSDLQEFLQNEPVSPVKISVPTPEPAGEAPTR